MDNLSQDLFGFESAYARLCRSMKPDAKMRGFFHYLAVKAKHGGMSEGVPSAVVLWNDGTPLEARREIAQQERAGSPALTVTIEGIPDDTEGKEARMYFLTPGMYEKVCASIGDIGVDDQVVMRRVVDSLKRDELEISRVLAAVPHGDVVVSNGEARMTLERPDQAATTRIPGDTRVVLVVLR